MLFCFMISENLKDAPPAAVKIFKSDSKDVPSLAFMKLFMRSIVCEL